MDCQLFGYSCGNWVIEEPQLGGGVQNYEYKVFKGISRRPKSFKEIEDDRFLQVRSLRLSVG
jgi:hypothetical protein